MFAPKPCRNPFEMLCKFSSGGSFDQSANTPPFLSCLRSDLESFDSVKRLVLFIEKMFGRMVYVEQNRIKLSLFIENIKTRPRQFKKIPLPQFTAFIFRSNFSERHESSLMPINHFLKFINHQQRTDILIFQSRRRRVTQTETADHDIEFARQSRQTEITRVLLQRR